MLVLDGRQLGPICRCVPLPLPRAAAHRSASPDDAARALFFQASTVFMHCCHFMSGFLQYNLIALAIWNPCMHNRLVQLRTHN